VYLSDYYLNQTINNRVSRVRVARLDFQAKFQNFGLVSSWLVLKISVGLLALFGLISSRLALKSSFGLFFAEIGSYEGKNYYSISFGNTIAKSF